MAASFLLLLTGGVLACSGLAVPTPTPAGSLGQTRPATPPVLVTPASPGGAATQAGGSPAASANPGSSAAVPASIIQTPGASSVGPAAANATTASPASDSTAPSRDAATPTRAAAAPTAAQAAGVVGASTDVTPATASSASSLGAASIAVGTSVTTLAASGPSVVVVGSPTFVVPPGAAAAATPLAAAPTATTISQGPQQPQAGSTFFGVYGWNPDATVELNAVRDAGMGLAQVAVDWSKIEPVEGFSDDFSGRPGAFHPDLIAPLDARLARISAAGVEPLLLVVNPPFWALLERGTQGPILPDKYGRFASFVARLAQRYGTAPYGVRYVVLAPEPDHVGTPPPGCPAGPGFLAHHRGWGDQPSAFAAMLRDVYPAVKAARPEVKVIPGALAYDNFGGPSRPAFNAHPCGPFNFTFLDEVVAAGGAQHFDVFAFNSYSYFAAGWEANSSGYDIAAKAGYLRQKFPQFGAKPMFVLEAGTWSDPATEIPQRLPNGSLGSIVPSEEYQAAYPAKLYARARAVSLGAVLWYGFRDQDAPGGDARRGLLDVQGRPKKAHAAHRQATRRLGAAVFERALPSGSTEGYVFTLPGGGRMAVVWAAGDLSARAQAQISLPGGNIRAEDHYGSPLSGFQVSGDTVTLDVGHEPVFLLSGSSP